MILLHLIEDQWSMLAWLFLSARAIIKPICEDKSLLLANDASVKMINWRESGSSGAKRSPLVGLLIYYCRRLLRCLVSPLFRLITCAVKERLNAASGWQTLAI